MSDTTNTGTGAGDALNEAPVETAAGTDSVSRDNRLGRGRGQVGGQHVGVGRVEHRGLDRRVEQCGRVVHEVAVQRVVRGDEHRERA